MDQSNITQTILNTINYIFETLLSSIDNRLYGILDDLTFVNSDILHDNYFSKIFGTSTTNGILLIANSLLLGILLYFAVKYFNILTNFGQSNLMCKFKVLNFNVLKM